MAYETSPEVEADLDLDLRVYGNCFWKVKDGKKVRVHPMDVRYDRFGTPRDSTNWPVEKKSIA